jgi:hypothetical protein
MKLKAMCQLAMTWHTQASYKQQQQSRQQQRKWERSQKTLAKMQMGHR